MPHFYYEDESFEFLYNISVGIERLQKITIVLLTHSDQINQEEFEVSLITHNHQDLNSRIEKIKDLKLGKSHYKFLDLLVHFYKTTRYGKFNLMSVYEPNQERDRLIKFIEKELNIEVSIDILGCTSNSPQIKKFIGKIVGKFCMVYYQIIKDRCRELNIYTYEVPFESKAFKVFIAEQYNFLEERIIQQEILKHLLQNDLSKGFKEYLNKLPALKLDSYDTNYYVNHLFDFHKKYDLKDELEELYIDDVKNVKERLEYLEPIGHSDASFEEYDEEE